MNEDEWKLWFIADALLKFANTYIWAICIHLKYIYSEKAAKFCEISTVDLSYVVTIKSTVEISQTFMAFSEYLNFTRVLYCIAIGIYIFLLNLEIQEW